MFFAFFAALNWATSSCFSAGPAHCRWFLTKIWMTSQPTSAPRSQARWRPPEMDMWAPRFMRPSVPIGRHQATGNRHRPEEGDACGLACGSGNLWRGLRRCLEPGALQLAEDADAVRIKLGPGMLLDLGKRDVVRERLAVDAVVDHR